MVCAFLIEIFESLSYFLAHSMVPQNIGPLQNNIMIIRYFIYLGSMLSTYKPSSVIFTCPKAVFSWFKPTFLLNSMDSIAFVAFSSKFSCLNSRLCLCYCQIESHHHCPLLKNPCCFQQPKHFASCQAIK